MRAEAFERTAAVLGLFRPRVEQILVVRLKRRRVGSWLSLVWSIHSVESGGVAPEEKWGLRGGVEVRKANTCRQEAPFERLRLQPLNFDARRTVKRIQPIEGGVTRDRKWSKPARFECSACMSQLYLITCIRMSLGFVWRAFR